MKIEYPPSLEVYQGPPWMNEKIKSLVKKKNAFYCSQSISNKYYERLAIKFNDPQRDSETYWSILKTFFNGIKIPVVPLLENNKFITDFKLKANFFY